MTSPRLLLVDDEEGIRITVAANLELAGFAVVEAENGPRALEAIEAAKGAFDLVLSDIRMPGMTGVELFHEIRARWPELPVRTLVGKSKESGRVLVLYKPIEAKELRVWVRNGVAMARLARMKRASTPK